MQLKAVLLRVVFYRVKLKLAHFQKVNCMMVNVDKKVESVRKIDVGNTIMAGFVTATANTPQNNSHKTFRIPDSRRSRYFFENCWFFRLRFCTREFDNERLQLVIMGSTRCFAQSLPFSLLPSEVHYLSSKLKKIKLGSSPHISPQQNQGAFLPMVSKSRKQRGMFRAFFVPKKSRKFADGSIPTKI